MDRHSCKVCGRSFPSGRSLGGHIRSHVVLSSRLEAEKDLVGRYRLRENPKKSWRLSDASVDKEKGTLCTKCGKGFGSWNSLFEHMKCHSEINRDELIEVDEEEETLESNGSYEEEMGSLSYSDVTTIALPSRRRRRSRRVAAISADSSQPAPSSEYEKEQEDGAFCLLMLSKGAGSATDSSDKISAVLKKEVKTSESDFPRIELKKNQSLPSESGFSLDDGDQDLKKPKASSFSSESFDELADEKKNLNSAVAESGKRAIVPRQCDSDSEMHNSKKRCTYECTTCNKIFHSYQALGGHRASHKMIKGDSSESPATRELALHNYNSQTSQRLTGKSRDHECSICCKVFTSGQALGGHKRSHLVAANTAASKLSLPDQKASKLSLIDLNLPAPDDESSYNLMCTGSLVKLQSYRKSISERDYCSTFLF